MLSELHLSQFEFWFFTSPTKADKRCMSESAGYSACSLLFTPSVTYENKNATGTLTAEFWTRACIAGGISQHFREAWLTSVRLHWGHLLHFAPNGVCYRENIITELNESCIIIIIIIIITWLVLEWILLFPWAEGLLTKTLKLPGKRGQVGWPKTRRIAWN